ncbi:RNA polymerase sigma factor [Thermobifida cellulosilytica]|uniref:Sigma-70 family RNA polymerase sigma factor n=1 Tax=Thermobifida cellulosilytica TB100 TaxID=665004 RepID=A0A147KDS7_THECS|nr:hypothetical protein [Thermobifida cellulosilytica]KUP95435.1 hypothetical protein AC529_17850 [Thermobifida cellulosilytica TB100]
MTDLELLQVLRSGSADPAHACGLLFDTYGEDLYRHCRAALRDEDAAQSALRDTLIVALAHIDRLSDPALLRDWLHALADAECARHEAVAGRAEEEAPREPTPSAALRVRVLSAAVAPELAEYRSHVAARGDHFDRQGFPLPAADRRSPGSSVVPAVIAGVGAVVALAAALFQLAVSTA